MAVPKIKQGHDEETRNIINRAIEVLNQLGINVQDLVANGQLTPEQYANLINVIEGHLKSGEITTYDLDSSNFKLDQRHMTEKFLTQMAGDTPISSVFADESVTRAKLAENAVLPKSLSFAEKPNNIIHFDNAIIGYSFDHATGEPIENQYYLLTDFIPVLPNKDYASAHISTAFLFDSAMNYVTRRTSNNFSTQDNIYFIRFSVDLSEINNAQVNEGTELKEYDVNEYSIGGEHSRLLINPTPKSIEKGALKKAVVNPENTAYFERSNNLFNKNDVTNNKRLDPDTGEPYDFLGRVTTDFIAIEPDTQYSKSINHAGIHFYNRQKKSLGHLNLNQQNSTFTTYKNAEFIRLDVAEISKDEFMLNEGEPALDYESYGFVLRSTNKNPITISESLLTGVPDDLSDGKNSNYNYDRYDISPAFLGTYSANEMEDKSVDSTSPLANMTANDIYDLFDDLMDANPDYITKEFLGNDVTGLPIYKYEFIPDIPRQNAEHNPTPTKFLKMGITAGVHGVEKQCVWTNYLAFREICNDWKNDPLLEALRWEVHFVVIPLANPWGFENNERKNANGVDINRNFIPEWNSNSNPEDSTYGGPEPLSELETQYIYDVMQDNLDSAFFIDFHNFFYSPYGTQKTFIYTYSHSKYGLTKSKSLISRMSRKWVEERDFLTEHRGMFGYAALMKGASVSQQSFALGLNGMTFEQNRYFELESGHKDFNSISNTLGLEAYVNFLASLLKDSNVLNS